MQSIKLKDYQIPIFDRIAGQQEVALFLQMRLGKTILAIKWLQSTIADLTPIEPVKLSGGSTPIKSKNSLSPGNASLQSGKVLIICPNSLMLTWCQEFSRYGLYAVILKEKEDYRPDIKVFITSYNRIICRDIHAYANWTHVILDESQNIRNIKTTTCGVILTHYRHISHKCLLSGTPAPESVLDYFTQMYFLFGSLCGYSNFYNLRKAICIQDHFKWEVSMAGKEKVTREVHAKCIVSTRKLHKVDDRKIYKIYSPKVPKSILRLHKKIETEWATDDEEFTSTFEVIAALRKTANSKYKIKSLKRLLGKVTLPCIVWFTYNDEGNSLKKICPVIDGRTSVDERTEAVAAFQSGTINLIAFQVQCGKYGFTLSRAKTAIFLSNLYSSEIRTQAEDRIIKADAENTVVIYDICTKTLIDRHIRNLIIKKKNKANKTLEQLKEIYHLED